jgi:hypothetical protein
MKLSLSSFASGKRSYCGDVTQAGWSPADTPYAVALSEANAWKRAIELSASRMGAGDPDEQTDARLFLLALRLLLRAQRMASEAVQSLPKAVAVADSARQRFDGACPGVKEACDMIEHFAEYAVGKGHRQPGGKLRQVDRPVDRAAAAQDWPLAYDRDTGRILLGSIEIDVAEICEQARHLVRAIWTSVRTFEDSLTGQDP